MEELREKLANLCHEQWTGWMKYLYSKTKFNSEGDMVIPVEYRDRWYRQITTSYSELPENEQESDRIEADRFLAILKSERQALVERIAQQVKGLYKHLGHTEHSHKDEWYECICCMDDTNLDKVLELLKEEGKDEI